MRKRGSGKVSDEFVDTILCEKMGWTYQELMDTPDDFIEVLCARLATEGVVEAEHYEELERKMSRKK